MSSCPGLTLEAWLADDYSVSEDSTVHQQLVALYEPYREYVELKLEDFDEDTQSWRAYNSAVFGEFFPKELEAKAAVIRWENARPHPISKQILDRKRARLQEITMNNPIPEHIRQQMDPLGEWPTSKEAYKHPYFPSANEAQTKVVPETKGTARMSEADNQGQYISDVIRARIKASGAPFLANDNISEFIRTNELDLLQQEVQAKFQPVLEALLIDTQNDHNTEDTAKRWSKMMVYELFGGRYSEAPPVTVFPNVKQVDEMYVVGPIESRSSCAHHLVPIVGKVWVGVIPGERLIGLSKFHRIIDHIGSRPQIQEEFTEQIADTLEELTAPRGIAVVTSASHLCCGHRGVKDAGSRMVTNVMRGDFKTNPTTRAEFLRSVELTKDA